jgi:ABC-type amino acid transport system permease subunit
MRLWPGTPTRQGVHPGKIGHQESSMNRGYLLKLALVWVGIFVVLAAAFRLLEFDLAFMSHWVGFLFQGIGYTIIVSAISIFFAVILALIGALARLSKNPIANGLSTFYVSFIRGIVVVKRADIPTMTGLCVFTASTYCWGFTSVPRSTT